MTAPPDDAFLVALARMGVIVPGDRPVITPLTGGVSSDVVRVDVGGRAICVKRALPKLKVAAHWEVSIERNAAEVAWLGVAASIVPAAVPRVLGEDRRAGLFAMEFLDPATHPVWKDLLRDGVVEPDSAAAVGAIIGRIHAATAGNAAIAAEFGNDAVFHSIRLEPYLHATALAHPDLAAALLDIARVTATTRLALVHGDVSPKNILIGPNGPVFLDAECATYGDPAFDLAFCLNHLLLKCVWRPAHTSRYVESYQRLTRAYLDCVTWEPARALDRRTARLLPALLLARIDGKSPVEYITAEGERTKVRAFARRSLQHPREGLSRIARDWRDEVNR